MQALCEPRVYLDSASSEMELVETRSSAKKHVSKRSKVERTECVKRRGAEGTRDAGTPDDDCGLVVERGSGDDAGDGVTGKGRRWHGESQG